MMVQEAVTDAATTQTQVSKARARHPGSGTGDNRRFEQPVFAHWPANYEHAIDEFVRWP